MSCQNCGRPWDGTSAYCPDCTVRLYPTGTGPTYPQIVETSPSLSDVLRELREAVRLLKEIEYYVRTRR